MQLNHKFRVLAHTSIYTCVYICACLMIDSVLVSRLEFCCPVRSARRCQAHLQKVPSGLYMERKKVYINIIINIFLYYNFSLKDKVVNEPFW